MIVVLLAFIAGIGFALATLLVETTLGTSRTFHHFAMVIAAGILLGVALADLIPETFESIGTRKGGFAIAGGFLVLYLIETLTHGHTHHHEPHAQHFDGTSHAHVDHHEHAHQVPHGADDEDNCVPTHAIMPFLIGLGLHNLADGLVIGASHEISDGAATGVAAGILIHQLPVGLSFAAVLLASGVTRNRMRLNALMIGALIPIGALIEVIVPGGASGDTLGIMIGGAAGALLYIATGHLLPEAHSEESRPTIAAAFLIALLGTMLFVTMGH